MPWSFLAAHTEIGQFMPYLHGKKGGLGSTWGPMAQRLEEHTLINAMLPQTHLVAVLEAGQALWLCRERGRGFPWTSSKDQLEQPPMQSEE